MKLTIILLAALFAGTASFAAGATPTIAPAAPPPSQAEIVMPSSDVLIVLIRSTLDALNQANITNNYTVLNGLGSISFAANNPPAKLAMVFEPFRANGINLSGTLVTTPILDQPAKIEQGRLLLVGHLETRPQVTRYNLIFEPTGGAWRISDLNVSMTLAK